MASLPIWCSQRVKKILASLGQDSRRPKITPARGPPLWGGCDAVAQGGDTDADAEWEPSAQPAPQYQVDQRIDW